MKWEFGSDSRIYMAPLCHWLGARLYLTSTLLCITCAQSAPYGKWIPRVLEYKNWSTRNVTDLLPVIPSRLLLGSNKERTLNESPYVLPLNRASWERPGHMIAGGPNSKRYSAISISSCSPFGQVVGIILFVLLSNYLKAVDFVEKPPSPASSN